MSDTPDIEALARRYLDLWQDQMAAMAADPALAETLARSFGALAGNSIFEGTGARRQPRDEHDAPAPADAAAAGSPSADAAPDGPGGDAGGLARRVAELESRVAALEAQLAARAGKRAGRSKP